jgi:hypothetical protein
MTSDANATADGRVKLLSCRPEKRIKSPRFSLLFVNYISPHSCEIFIRGWRPSSNEGAVSGPI